MKKIMIASGLLALMAAATSCDKYDIYPEQYGDVLLIKDGGEKELTCYSTDPQQDYYISVMKGGHTPGREAQAQLRVMSATDFRHYLDENYGDGFEGMKILPNDLYDLYEGDGTTGIAAEGQKINHHFTGADDRYFGATVRVKASAFAKYYNSLSDDEKNTANFVIPVGLYSETDSVNALNNAVIIQPKATKPSIKATVDNDDYNFEEISRVALVNLQKGDTKQISSYAGCHIDEATGRWVYEPEVYFSVPCENPWGFELNLKTAGGSSVVAAYNSNTAHSITLTHVPTKPAEGSELTYYELGDKVTFEPGQTKARIPLKLFLDAIDPDAALSMNYVVPIQWVAQGKVKPLVDWTNSKFESEDEAEFVKDQLVCEPSNGSTFFVGYRIIEAPLDLSEGNVTTNDLETTEGSIANLFDDNLGTFYHSAWSSGAIGSVERDAEYGSYLQVDVPEDINSCFFQITARNSLSLAPKVVRLWYSNNETQNEEEYTWSKLGKYARNGNYTTADITINNMKAGQTLNIGEVSDMFITPDKSKIIRLRFSVLKNFNNVDLTGAASGSACWNLAEFKMYGKMVD